MEARLFTLIKTLENFSDYRLKMMASSIKVDGVPLRTAAEVRHFLRKMQMHPDGVVYIPAKGCIHYNSKREGGCE